LMQANTMVIINLEIDMAERIYFHWKHQNQSYKSKSTRTISEVMIKKLKENIKHLIANIPNVRNTKETQTEDIRIETKPEIKKEAIVRSNMSSLVQSINNISLKSNKEEKLFDRLHLEYFKKQEMQEVNERLRKAKEMSNCTFKPKIIKHNSSQTTLNTYERLSQSNRIKRQEYYELQKKTNELRYCTFQPQTLSQSFSETEEAVCDRLYRQGEITKQVHKMRAQKRKEKELSECTFKPIINTRRSESKQSRDERINEMQKEYEMRNRELAKKAIQQEESIKAHCTFQPKLISKAKSNVEEEVPYYERLYKRHEQKQKMLERKRQELIEEEQKLKLFVSKNSNSEPGFNRLYEQDKIYKQKKADLSKKVMKERGISFTPRINDLSIKLLERSGYGVVERNKRGSVGVATELREDVLEPRVE